MTNKNLIKPMTAFGMLAALLIFLGVNFVPLISARSPANNSALKEAINAGSESIERSSSTVAGQVNYAGSDWIERHPSAGAGVVNYAGSDWIERHPSAGAGAVNNVDPDRIRRHLPR